MSFFIIAKVAFLRLNVASLNAVKNAISFAHLATRVHQSVSLHFHFHRRDHPRAPQTVVNSVWSLGSLVCAVSLLFRTGGSFHNTASFRSISAAIVLRAVVLNY